MLQEKKKITNTIWECYYDFDAPTKNLSVEVVGSDEKFFFTDEEPKKGGWCVERIRTDKTSPNDERVVRSVFESICDGVTFEELVDVFYEYRRGGKLSVAEHCKLPDYYKEFASPATRETLNKRDEM